MAKNSSKKKLTGNVGPSTGYAIELVHLGENEIVLDYENYEAQITKVKKQISNINSSLKDVKKRYKNLANDSQTKGSIKKSITKIVNGTTKKINTNKTVSSTLESSLLKSTKAMASAMQSSVNELNAKAEKLNQEKISLEQQLSEKTTPTPTPAPTPTPTETTTSTGFIEVVPSGQTVGQTTGTLNNTFITGTTGSTTTTTSVSRIGNAASGIFGSMKAKK